jgi:DNA-binding MarR family transcriptional regulator
MASAKTSVKNRERTRSDVAPPSGNKRRKSKSPAHLTVTRPELLTQGDDNEFRKLVHDSLAFAARLVAIRDGYGSIMGITGPQYTILISIAHLNQSGDVSVSSVAEHLHLSGSFVTNEVGKLIQLGLVEKVQDTADRRRVLLTVSDAGWEKFKELATIQSRVNDVHFGCLSREDFVTLRRIMSELVDCTDQALMLLRYLTAEPPQPKAGR